MMSGSFAVRFATPDDFAWCHAFDDHLAVPALQHKLHTGEIILAERDGERVGYLRLEYLWSLLPYIALIRVIDSHQRQGVGRALLTFCTNHLRTQGHSVLLSSSQADEAAPQAWHRHMGFEECGFLAGINDGGIGEVFFRKSLK